MARFCINCGKEIPDAVAFCTECGAAAPAATPQEAPKQQEAPVSAPPPVAAPATTAVVEPPKAQPYTAPMPTGSDIPAKGSKYEPITTGGYIGSMLLMSVPVLGWIITIIWACGGCRKINKRNLARAMLIFLVVALILGVIAYFVGRTLWGNLLESAGISDLTGQFGGLDGIQELLEQLKELQNLQLPTTP